VRPGAGRCGVILDNLRPYLVEQRIDHPLVPQVAGMWLRVGRYATATEAHAVADGMRATGSAAERVRVLDEREVVSAQVELFGGAE